MGRLYDRTLEYINREVRCRPEALVARADGIYRTFIDGATARIRAGGTRLVLLAGPSGSGKTTTANLLADALRRQGVDSHVISLDNFYKESADPTYPRLPDGSRDMETYEALDLALLTERLTLAAEGAAFSVPRYDFKTGRREEDAYAYAASDTGVVIVEGLHALNPVITHRLPRERCLNVFISVSTNLTYRGERILSGKKLRFCRRLVRDYLYRGADAARTLELWQGVLHGEELYLYPHRHEGDIHMNTFHAYELPLLAPYVLHVLRGAPESDFVDTVRRAAMLAAPLAETYVPKDVLLREFIPGGVYEHLY